MRSASCGTQLRKPIAPALWEAELANVVWMAIRSGILPAREGPRRLASRSRPRLKSGMAVYDTLFVELAIRERLPLATFDVKALAAFPATAKRPGVLLPK